MARTSLVAAVLLLVLIANHTDWSTSMLTMNQLEIEKYCMEATYKNNNLADFAKLCAPKTWKEFFGDEKVLKALELATEIKETTKEEIALGKKNKKFKSYQIEPRMEHMFEAFKRVKPKDIKVIILGQDPTPQVGKATGRAFSVKDPRTVGSVMNVLLEVALEGWSVDLDNGDLSSWEAQGVLLLNSALTIGEITYEEEKQTKKQKVSHLGYWCPFTKLLIEYISRLQEPSVWMLLGKVAQDFTVNRKFNSLNQCFNENQASETNIKHEPSLIEKGYILTGGHPSSLAGVGAKNTFFAGSYFYCANEFLYEKRGVWVDWGLRYRDKKRHDVNNKLALCPKINNNNKQHLFTRKRKQRRIH